MEQHQERLKRKVILVRSARLHPHSRSSSLLTVRSLSQRFVKLLVV